VNPTPTWDPTNIREVDYPFDGRFETINLCRELVVALLPVKAKFEQAMTYTHDAAVQGPRERGSGGYRDADKGPQAVTQVEPLAREFNTSLYMNSHKGTA
jgi:hypothetical protein